MKWLEKCRQALQLFATEVFNHDKSDWFDSLPHQFFNESNIGINASLQIVGG
jgi:hypothetical protein